MRGGRVRRRRGADPVRLFLCLPVAASAHDLAQPASRRGGGASAALRCDDGRQHPLYRAEPRLSARHAHGPDRHKGCGGALAARPGLRAGAGRRRSARGVSRASEGCRVRAGRTRPYKRPELLHRQAARPHSLRRPSRRLRRLRGRPLDCRRRAFHVSAMTDIAHARHQHHGHEPAPAGLETDPVCGMSVDPATARHRADHAGRDVFLLRRALPRALRRRTRALCRRPSRRPPPAAPQGALWTCPMHPEIVRDGPGSCPICGMALEPMTPAAGDAGNPELADMTRRFWVGVVLSVPLLVMAMAEHVVRRLASRADLAHRDLGAAGARDAGRAVGRRAVLPARLAVAGQPPSEHVHADRARHRRRLSLQPRRDRCVPGIFPASFRGPEGGVPVYFEAAAVIVTLVLLGQVLELRARSQTSTRSAPCSTSRRNAPASSRRTARARCRSRLGHAGPAAARAARREGAGRRRRRRGAAAPSTNR